MNRLLVLEFIWWNWYLYGNLDVQTEKSERSFKVVE